MKIIVVWGLIKRCSQPVKAFEKLHSNTIRYVENPYAKKGFLVFLVINLQHSREKQVFSSPVLISCNGFVSDEQFCLSTILSKFECYSSQYSSRYISVLSAWVYIWLFARLICFSKNFPFFTFHALETQFPEFSKKFRSSFEGFMVRPAVSFDQVIDTIKEVLNFVPTLCILEMTIQLFCCEMIRVFTFITQRLPKSIKPSVSSLIREF